ncbi:hypothetical protein Rin_00011170 [Candidatus Regiella insecticola 5.15]|uniref:Uncharacterized protein n=1 Tax=Candidatus Regiella insecticola 5.15 TaxID=1005043 RepID=G2GZA2_9ENTR|nr:hypothetical protein Rin_00011170 [Candidatus Regiella insecticola 5.15]
MHYGLVKTQIAKNSTYLVMVQRDEEIILLAGRKMCAVRGAAPVRKIPVRIDDDIIEPSISDHIT